MSEKPAFLNFQVDHMTMLVDPALYAPAYLMFRVIFGVPKSDILYEKRKEWEKGKGEVSMTFAVKVGEAAPSAKSAMTSTIMAIVQPSEPKSRPSHVRRMLQDHSAGAHWQHIALRTPDLLAFHKHALERGVNFITPILKDDDEDLIQVFSGEWFAPGGSPSAVFFEFVQRDPTPELLKKLADHNREAWFRDKTFLGLYGEKETEYQKGRIAPFIDEELFARLAALARGKQVFELTEADVAKAEEIMLGYTRSRNVDAAA
jgi:hypothetical protein